MDPLNSTIASQLNHRTIRKFGASPIPPEQFEQLIEVARRTATSRNMQHASIIRVTDQALREDLAEVATQAYMAEAPELWIFIVDTHRSQSILEEQSAAGPGPASMDSFTEGFTDACLMAQNVVVAAESLGLGTNYFGNILNDAERVIELLALPPLTFPVVGLCIGAPAQEPQLKPRMEMKLRVMENQYTEPESWAEALVDYDEVLQTYYDLREPGRAVDSFTKQTVARMAAVKPNRAQLLRVVRKQGYDLAL